MRSTNICGTIAAILSALATSVCPVRAGNPPLSSALQESIDFLQQAYQSRTKPDAEEWKRRVEAKHADLTAKLDWLIANNRGEDALRFVVPFAYFLSVGNQQKQAIDVFTRVLQLPGARPATALRAQALYDAGLLAFRQRDQARSRALNQESLEIGRQLGDGAATPTALIGLSRVALREHDYKKVKAYAQEAAEIRGKLGNEAGRISAMHMIAAASRMEGADAEAQQIYETTLATYRATGERRRAAGELFNLGYVHLHQNQPAKALERFNEALQEYRATNDEAGIAYCLTGFAALAAIQKQAERAAELYGAAAVILERLGITLDPDDQLDLERYSKVARDQIKNTDYEAAYARGKTLTMDQAVTLALSSR